MTGVFDEAEVRQPNPDTVITVSWMRQGIAELAAANNTLYQIFHRDQKIRAICQRNECDSWARQIMNLLDETNERTCRDARLSADAES